MAMLILTFKIMPTSPEIDLEKLTEQVKETITSFKGNIKETLLEPVAFGLKAILAKFSFDEANGSTDALEDALTALEEVMNVETVAISRAMG